MDDSAARAKAWLEPMLKEIVMSDWRKHLAVNRVAGYVYVLQGSEFYADAYKIGMTVETGQRLATISTAAPFEIRLIHTIKTDDMEALEAMLHGCFRAAGKHIRNEWFRLTDDDVSAIVAIGAQVDRENIEAAQMTIRRRVAEIAPALTDSEA